MAADHDGESGGRGIDFQLMDVMNDVDSSGFRWHHRGQRQTRRPLSGIDISTHRNHWRDGLQLLDNLGLSHIPGVNDQLTAFERPYGLAWLLQLAAELREWEDPQAR